MAAQQQFITDPEGLGLGFPIIGANSIQFSVGDAVYINTSGFLDLSSTTNRILGFSTDSVTMSATNQTVALVCPAYVPAGQVTMYYPMSSAPSQTMIGEYADFSSATTNAQTVSSTTSASTGQFFIVGIDTTNTAVYVQVAEQQRFDYAQP